MKKDLPIFGVKAEVLLKFEGELNSLADKLSDGFVHVPFEVEPREVPPYDIVGSCEALGFEIWLEEIGVKDSWQYRFRMEIEHCIEESFNDQMHDLSLWLARYITSICGVEATAKIPE